MIDSNLNTPAERLRWARIKAGYSSAASAAAAFGWKAPTYTSDENGTRNVTFPKAKKYARAFKVDFLWILEGKGSNNLEHITISSTETPLVTGNPLERIMQEAMNLVESGDIEQAALPFIVPKASDLFIEEKYQPTDREIRIALKALSK